MALDSCGVTALTAGLDADLGQCCWKRATASAVVPPLPANATPGAQWHHPRGEGLSFGPQGTPGLSHLEKQGLV